MKSERAIREELRRVERLSAATRRDVDRERQDWMYGAEVALAWARGEDVMSPSKAFAPPAPEEKP